MTDAGRPVRFRPRARLVSILGEHLISDQAVGLIELVKNAYDADATHVEVVLKNLADPGDTIVIIRDDGCGMTASDVEEKWLSPAVDHKEKQKAEKRRTARGRLPIGEKGVGRFAVQQLGHRLRMVTRSAGHPEVVLDIDWDAFDNGEGFLDDRILRLVERNPMVYTMGQMGTTLIITGARSKWTSALVRKVQRALRRLQSPVKGHADFVPILRCPDYPEYEQLGMTDILDRAHYSLSALIDKDGRMDYDYVCRLPGISPRRISEEDIDLGAIARSELGDRRPGCGPFYLHFYVWDRRPDLLSKSGVSREDLDAHCGVSLFRDGLRVLPYGEQGDDWLQLDRERINDPSHRIGNNQIIGYVEVDQTENPELRDKTNREGLIDNPAFQEMRALVRGAITVFTGLWLNDRPRPESQRPEKKRRTAPRIPPLDLHHLTRALEDSVRDDILVPINSDGHESGLPSLDGSFQHGLASVGATTPPISQRQAVQMLVEELEEAQAARTEAIRQEEGQRELLLGLAATGLAAERVVHEFGRQVVAAFSALAQLRDLVRANSRAVEALGLLEACLGALRNECRELAPFASLERTQRTARVDVAEMVHVAFQLNAQLLTGGHITATAGGTTFKVRARAASLAQVFDNLVNNACWWLASDEANQNREIHVDMDADRQQVTVWDNGPGVAEHLRDMIFMPMVTGRVGGRGLGLYIVSELMEQMGSTVELDINRTDRGARFILHFPTNTGA